MQAVSDLFRGLFAEDIRMSGDEGNDDVLLVLQMAQKGAVGLVQGLSEPGGCVASCRGTGRDRLMEGEAGLEEGVEVGVDGVVVGVQQIDPGPNARLHTAHGREIVVALDIVVAIEVLEEALQRRDQLAMQIGQGEGAGAPLGCQAGHGRSLAPEAGVHLKPEPGHGTDLRLVPAQAGEGLDQIAVGLGQALAGRKIGVRQQPQPSWTR